MQIVQPVTRARTSAVSAAVACLSVEVSHYVDVYCFPAYVIERPKLINNGINSAPTASVAGRIFWTTHPHVVRTKCHSGIALMIYCIFATTLA